MNKICILGLGYIGLPTMATLGTTGYKVIGVDINESIVEKIKNRRISTKEPNLDNTINTLLSKKQIKVKSSPEESDAFIITVPTPLTINKQCNLSYVISALNSIIPLIKKGNIIIIESTIPPGTTNNILKPKIEKTNFTVGKDVYLAHCPERVLPGNIMYELVYNNRIIGGCTVDCSRKVLQIYESFVKGKIMLTDSTTAEMTKLVENTFRDVNIAFANELAMICNRLDINVLEVIKLANKHPRVNILQPGPGVGGHCLAIDPYFIIEKMPKLSKIISLARTINNYMPFYIVSIVNKLLHYKTNSKITILGLSYKGNISDTRRSPAINIYNLLKDQGYNLSVYDPLVNHNKIRTSNLNMAIKDSDLMLILSDHDEFKKIDFKDITKKMNKKIVFDTKNIISRDDLADSDIIVKNLGNHF